MQDDEKILNERISQLDDEINSLYTDIGREYYELNPDHPQSDGMASCFQKIEDRKAEIRDLNDQIQALKGIIKCPHCGAEISKDNTFCPACGSRIISEFTVSVEKEKCPNCGNAISPGQNFCPKCGAKIVWAEPADESMNKTRPTLIWNPGSDGVKEDPVTDGSESKTYEAKQPVMEKSSAEEPVMDEPVVEEPFAEEPAIKEPVIEEPVMEEPKAEESIASESSEIGVCKYCGKEYVKGMTFCIFCGKEIDPSFIEEVKENQPDQVTHEKIIICPNCGKSVSSDNQFCIYCGQKF